MIPRSPGAFGDGRGRGQSRKRSGPAAIAVLAVLLLPFGGLAETDVPLIVQARVGQLLNGNEVKVAGESIASTVVLPPFYERGEYRPAWTEDIYNRDPAELKALNGSFSFNPRAVSTAAGAGQAPR